MTVPVVPIVLKSAAQAVPLYNYLVALRAAIVGPPNGIWQNGGNAFGAGVSVLGTTDPGDTLHVIAANNIVLASNGTFLTLAAAGNPVLQSDGNNTTVYAPGLTLTLAAPDGAANLVAGGGAATITGATNVRIAGLTNIGPMPTPPDPSAGLDLHTIVTLGLGLPQVPDATLLAIPDPLFALVAGGSTSSILRANVGTPSAPNWRKVAGGPLVRATNTSGQSIPSGPVTTVTNWTAVTNVGAAFVPSTGIFTAPVVGFYAVSFAEQFVPGTTLLGGAYRASLLQNAAVVETREITAQVAGIAGVFSPSLSTMLEMAAGDTLAPQAYQGTAGPLTLSANAPNNTFSVSLLS